MIKAILFDLDGVLVDACDWHYHALNDALKDCGYKKIEYSDHMTLYNGLPTSKKLEMLNIDKNDRKKIWELKQSKTLNTIIKFGKVDKYKQRMHSQLKNMGLHIVCVTNSIRKTATEMLKVTGQLEYMDFLISNEDVEKNKPHPDCYELAFKKLKLKKEECLIIEDSEKGIESAKRSGANIQKVDDVYDVTLDLIISRLK